MRSDPVLKRMGRRTIKAELVEIIENLREEIPDIILRTTLITGFPGETEEDHQELMDFVDQMEFDRLGVFTYSAGRRYTSCFHGGTDPRRIKGRKKRSADGASAGDIPGKGPAKGRTGSICDDRRSDFQEKVLILAGLMEMHQR